MSDKALKKSVTAAPIQELPVEIVTKIVQYLSLSDVIALTSVSKVWRSVYLNQNSIWKNLCKNLNLREDDYTDCIIDVSKSSSECKGYIETNSEKLFGPFCKWWTIYNRYNMVLKNIKDNNFPVRHIPRQSDSQSFCTDDYIININRHNKDPVEALNLKHSSSSTAPLKREFLKTCDLFHELIADPQYVIKIIGSKTFVVIEIHSVIFVYKLINGQFEFQYSKIVRRSVEETPKNQGIPPREQFLLSNSDTLIDIYEDKLALIRPSRNGAFIIDLNTGKNFKELKFSRKKCIVDCMKFSDDRLMIGISVKDRFVADQIKNYLAIVYHFDGGPINHNFKIGLFGAATQFKVTSTYIGVENIAGQTPFISKNTKLVHIFWLDCDTFSFDCTRKFIYYSINQSIFQYDLNKARLERFEVTQKIAKDAVSNDFSLTPINDRYLLIRSTMPNTYDIFDVKEHEPVKSIQLSSGYSLAHVGKLSVVFSNQKEFFIISFC